MFQRTVLFLCSQRGYEKISLCWTNVEFFYMLEHGVCTCNLGPTLSCPSECRNRTHFKYVTSKPTVMVMNLPKDSHIEAKICRKDIVKWQVFYCSLYNCWIKFCTRSLKCLQLISILPIKLEHGCFRPKEPIAMQRSIKQEKFSCIRDLAREPGGLTKAGTCHKIFRNIHYHDVTAFFILVFVHVAVVLSWYSWIM
jgi:hypothetical protein